MAPLPCAAILRKGLKIVLNARIKRKEATGRVFILLLSSKGGILAQTQ